MIAGDLRGLDPPASSALAGSIGTRTCPRALIAPILPKAGSSQRRCGKAGQHLEFTKRRAAEAVTWMSVFLTL